MSRRGREKLRRLIRGIQSTSGPAQSTSGPTPSEPTEATTVVEQEIAPVDVNGDSGTSGSSGGSGPQGVQGTTGPV